MHSHRELAATLSSCLLLFLLCSSSPTLAEIVLMGENHSFPPCVAQGDPIFSFQPHGKTGTPLMYAVGTSIRESSAKDRLGAVLQGDNILYSLSDIKGQDGGEYVCTYNSPNDPTFDLTVVDSKTTCPGALGPVNAGEKLTGNCTLSRLGKDPISLKWKHTDIIQNSIASEETTKAISTLDLEATPAINGQEFTCFMDDVQGVAPCTVTAVVNYPPQNVEISPATQAKLSGQEATVTCEASDANPNIINVKFKVKKGQDGAFEDAAADAVTGNALKLTVDDDYFVKCEAENGIDGMVTREAVINMITPAKMTGPLVQAPLPAVVGAEFNVTCPVEPNMAEVTWFKNEEEVSKEKVLVLTASRADLNAVVVCHAKVSNNGVVDAGVSANLTLDVAWEPSVEKVDKGEENDNGVITIVISGNPPPVVTVAKINSTFNESKVTEGTEVTVKLVYRKQDLPIEYQIFVDGKTEPITAERVETIATLPPPTDPPSNNAGTIAGIIIAVILICICAALLIIMWKKNLLCPKKGSLDVEKGTTASSDGGLSKPVELDEVEPEVRDSVEESQTKSAAPLLDDDDIKKPPVYENQSEIIPTNSASESFDDQPPAAPATPPPPPPPPLASPE